MACAFGCSVIFRIEAGEPPVRKRCDTPLGEGSENARKPDWGCLFRREWVDRTGSLIRVATQRVRAGPINKAPLFDSY